jgi:hypothetical protein
MNIIGLGAQGVGLREEERGKGKKVKRVRDGQSLAFSFSPLLLLTF